jgi:hypothetical protein
VEKDIALSGHVRNKGAGRPEFTFSHPQTWDRLLYKDLNSHNSFSNGSNKP